MNKKKCAEIFGFGVREEGATRLKRNSFYGVQLPWNRLGGGYDLLTHSIRTEEGAYQAADISPIFVFQPLNSTLNSLSQAFPFAGDGAGFDGLVVFLFSGDAVREGS